MLGRKLFNFVNSTHPHFTVPGTLMKHLRWGYSISCCANAGNLYPYIQTAKRSFPLPTPHQEQKPSTPSSSITPRSWTACMFVAVWWVAGGRESKGLPTKSLPILYHLMELQGWNITLEPEGKTD